MLTVHTFSTSRLREFYYNKKLTKNNFYSSCLVLSQLRFELRIYASTRLSIKMRLFLSLSLSDWVTVRAWKNGFCFSPLPLFLPFSHSMHFYLFTPLMEDLRFSHMLRRMWKTSNSSHRMYKRQQHWINVTAAATGVWMFSVNVWYCFLSNTSICGVDCLWHAHNGACSKSAGNLKKSQLNRQSNTVFRINGKFAEQEQSKSAKKQKHLNVNIQIMHLLLLLFPYWMQAVSSRIFKRLNHIWHHG